MTSIERCNEWLNEDASDGKAGIPAFEVYLD